MADETDVPPLEDMSDLLQKVQIIKEQRTKTSSQNKGKTEKNTISNGHCTVSDKNMAPLNKPAQIQSKPENTETKSNTKSSATVSESSSGFGGMKKGFMFGGGSSKPKSSQEKTKEASVPYVKKKEESLKLDEVQQAMSDTITSKKDEWMTDDLLSKVEKNESLLKKLQDPRFMEAVNMFQTNPTAAMERYKNDKETQDAFMQFCGLMGNHFTNIADKDDKTEEKTPPPKPSPKIIEEIDPTDSNKYVPTNPPSASQRGTILTRESQGGADMSVRSSTNPKQATAEDENKMQEILSHPDVMEVLMDPWIQNLFHVLRTDPGSGQRMLSDADSEKKKKIKKLVDVGMLQFQT
ncbi:unnamed protein product [Mytilus coruscus]|uniref:STI1/HOP DP domain-containing protein n=1 Tax=Mytilus coruscus TaxID=42192 RepID=A0A6J8CE88_MYTCO|nr:unnamed protein product [Mytilus coruscus]